LEDVQVGAAYPIGSFERAAAGEDGEARGLSSVEAKNCSATAESTLGSWVARQPSGRQAARLSLARLDFPLTERTGGCVSKAILVRAVENGKLLGAEVTVVPMSGPGCGFPPPIGGFTIARCALPANHPA
jgi:hypothetical protein